MGVAAVPGNGGVSRGRGDAELAYSGETPGRSDAFEAKELPPAEFLDPEASALLGVGSADPSVAPSGEAAGTAGARASAGGAAWKRRVAPRHRDAVESFFGPVPR